MEFYTCQVVQDFFHQWYHIGGSLWAKKNTKTKTAGWVTRTEFFDLQRVNQRLFRRNGDKTMAIWIQKHIHSLTLTYHLKMDGWNISFLLGWPIFRCYVCLPECTWETQMTLVLNGFVSPFFGGLKPQNRGQNGAFSKHFRLFGS